MRIQLLEQLFFASQGRFFCEPVERLPESVSAHSRS